MTVDFEDLTTSSKASENLRKQSGDYFETKFNYSLSFDNRNKDSKQPKARDCLRQGIPVVSEEYALLNSFSVRKVGKFKNEMVANFGVYGRAINLLMVKMLFPFDRLTHLK